MTNQAPTHNITQISPKQTRTFPFSNHIKDYDILDMVAEFHSIHGSPGLCPTPSMVVVVWNATRTEKTYLIDHDRYTVETLKHKATASDL